MNVTFVAAALPRPALACVCCCRHVYHYGAPASLEAYYQQVLTPPHQPAADGNIALLQRFS